MDKYTIKFKLARGKKWKVLEAGDFKYKNVDLYTLNEVIPEIYSQLRKKEKVRIFKNGKVSKYIVIS